MTRLRCDTRYTVRCIAAMNQTSYVRRSRRGQHAVQSTYSPAIIHTSPTLVNRALSLQYNTLLAFTHALVLTPTYRNHSGTSWQQCCRLQWKHSVVIIRHDYVLYAMRLSSKAALHKLCPSVRPSVCLTVRLSDVCH